MLYIVGGGPSLKHFDFTLLKDRRVWAINASFYDCAGAELIFWVDERLFMAHEQALLQHPGRKVTARYKKLRIDYPECVTELRLTGMTGYDPTPGHVRSGNNSGYALLNYAIQSGEKEIALLGFDMSLAAGKSHYHDRYGAPVKKETYQRRMAPYFGALAEAARRQECRIVNLSPTSLLDHWPKHEPAEFLKNARLPERPAHQSLPIPTA